MNRTTSIGCSNPFARRVEQPLAEEGRRQTIGALSEREKHDQYNQRLQSVETKAAESPSRIWNHTGRINPSIGVKAICSYP